MRFGHRPRAMHMAAARNQGIRMTGFARVAMVLLCLGLASCNQQKLIETFTPPAEAMVAKSTLDDLRHGQLDMIESRLAPQLQGDPTVDAKLRELTGYFPAGEPQSMTPLGASTNTFNGVKRVRLSYQYQFASAWVQASVAMVEDHGKILIEGVHVNRTAQSLQQTNAFSTKGKNPGFLLTLGLACVLPLFSLFALVVCLRTPMRGYKWLWAIFTLVGVATFHLNWTTGAFDMQLISAQLLSASMTQSMGGPWIIGLSFPLGAAVFLLRRRELMKLPESTTPPVLPRKQPPPL
jgi:hypothetical protein